MNPGAEHGGEILLAQPFLRACEAQRGEVKDGHDKRPAVAERHQRAGAEDEVAIQLLGPLGKGLQVIGEVADTVPEP